MKYIFAPLYRIWFYLMVLLPILVLLPFLILTTLSQRTYHWFFALARYWAYFVLYAMGFFPMVKGRQHIDPDQSYMLVANHTSMTDIMMMLILVKKPFVFVGKKELAKIPLFGFFYKRTCILVDRNDPRSRKAVFERAWQRLSTGVGICIFPEGGVPDDTSIVLDRFKDGAFRLAIEHQIPLLPISLYDNKQRFPFAFFEGGPGRMRAKIHSPISTEGMALPKDKVKVKQSVYDLLYADLTRTK